MIGWWLVIAYAALAVAIIAGLKWPRLWLGLTAGGAIAALVAGLSVLFGGAFMDWRSEFCIGGEPLHLRLDGLSAWFLVLLAVVGGLGAVYAREYWSDHHYPRSAARGRAWWSALVLSMALILTASNGLHFLIAWEAFAIAGYFLITLENRRPEVRKAGWLYLAASHAGTMGLFGFFALLAARTGSWDLGSMRGQAGLAPLFWLALAGFGVKAGLFPLHIWLPSAHANAPSHVSAILSAVAIKMGIYGIMRFSGWLPLPPAAGWVVIGLGALSALFGSAFAFAQTDYKRLLAYCSVENVGIILIGLGAAMLARTNYGDGWRLWWGPWALAGAMLHVWNHGAFKSLLFFGAGAVLHSTGTREMSRLGGLWRTMPWTAGLFAVGAVAVAGLPPLNGFVSEWLIYRGLFESTMYDEPSAWATIPAAILLAMAGALALATFVKAGSLIFLGMPRTQIAAKAHECGPWMRGPMLVLAGVCLVIGLLPRVWFPAILRAMDGWGTPYILLLSEPFTELGMAQLTLAHLVIIAALLLWRKVQANGLRRDLTWDCGYAKPTAKMQYTAGSFSGIGAGWFGWLLQPVRKLRRPRGQFPTGAIRLERTSETVLEKLLLPLGRVFMRVSTAVRRLQHGRLQTYIFYVLVGLFSLGVFVLLGGKL